jgi:hypothetical protein
MLVMPEAGRVMTEHVAYSTNALKTTLALPADERAPLDLRWAAATTRPDRTKQSEGDADPTETG